MASAFFWGFISASSLIVGALIASWVTLGRRTLGMIMGFGAGVLLSAVAYELVYESVHIAKLSGFPALGFFLGAFTFFIADMVVGRLSGVSNEGDGGGAQSALIVPLILAAILDGVPESVAIGLGILQGGSVSVAMLVAVFMSNIPESAGSTTGMRADGWTRPKILFLWSALALVLGAVSAAGYALLGGVSAQTLAAVQSFAGGAILMMLANTMIPEAYERAGKLAGVATVMGFAVAVSLVILEHS